MNLMQALDFGYNILKLSKINSYKIDTEILLSDSLNISKEKLILNLKEKINNKNYNTFLSKLNRRRLKEPIAYIIKKKEFWKNEFYLDQNVLIPRPETEHLVEETLKIIPKFRKKKNIRNWCRIWLFSNINFKRKTAMFSRRYRLLKKGRENSQN